MIRALFYALSVLIPIAVTAMLWLAATSQSDGTDAAARSIGIGVLCVSLLGIGWVLRVALSRMAAPPSPPQPAPRMRGEYRRGFAARTAERSAGQGGMVIALRHRFGTKNPVPAAARGVPEDDIEGVRQRLSERVAALWARQLG